MRDLASPLRLAVVLAFLAYMAYLIAGLVT